MSIKHFILAAAIALFGFALGACLPASANPAPGTNGKLLLLYGDAQRELQALGELCQAHDLSADELTSAKAILGVLKDDLTAASTEGTASATVDTDLTDALNQEGLLAELLVRASREGPKSTA